MSPQLLKIIKKICIEDGIELECFADDYVLCLNKNGQRMYIYGNKFPNNSSSSELLCDDKSALSQVLAKNGIPCVPHTFFASPAVWWSEDERELRQKRLYQMFSDNPKGLVAKDNRGSGGRNVYRLENQAEAEEIFGKIFALSDSAAVCPFVDILHEYRVLMLGEECVYSFEKIRSEKAGEWRHNLGQGATPSLVTDKALCRLLSTLAKKCMQVLNLSFASVDIIDDGKALQVLEINSGVMIESFSAFSEEYCKLAESGVKKAIHCFFGEEKV